MKKILFIGSLSISIFLIGISFFAEQIGIDNDSGWGTGRILLLNAGLISLAISILGLVFQGTLVRISQCISNAAGKFNKINYPKRMVILSLPAILIVFASYIWFARPNFESSRFNYYSLLAEAFKSHQLYLVEKPSTALLALENPYDYGLRKRSGVEDFPWDSSLYNNKFYLYWGPVPALPLTLFSVEKLKQIGDEYVVLAFMFGLFIYCILFGFSIWLKFNQSLPPWLFGISILAIGLSAPMTWILNFSRIYEGAIIGSQFFLIGGCYWAYSAIDDKLSNPYKLILCGVHWALALGTRITVLPVILFTTTMTLLYIFKKTKTSSFRSLLPALLYLGIPLFVAAVGLGWYNWARFNSILEFGIKYQLANVNYNVFNASFSAGYIKENLYNYFIHPVAYQRRFPYFLAIENTFSNERLAGLLYTSPYILFAALFFGKFIRPHTKQNPDAAGSWLIFTLTGTSLISTLMILSFYFPATRYGVDFTPSMLLLATASLGPVHQLFGKNNLAGKPYVVFIVLIAIFSITASTLIAFPPQKAHYMISFIKEFQHFFGLR